MKLTFRTVSGESFALEMSGSDTVEQMKTAVSESRSVPADTLKLVYKGKVLDNPAATVEQAGITEAGFIVVFVQAKKAAPAAAAPTPVCPSCACAI